MDDNNYINANVSAKNTISNRSLSEIDELGSEQTEPSLFDNLADKFGTILSGVTGVAGSMIPQVADFNQFNSLIDKQVYWQTQMQVYTAESNIEKSRHEVMMSPVRNLRIN